MPLDRRTFVKSLSASFAAPTVASALPTLPGGSEVAAPQPGKRPPNVVFMICDDLGYGDLGCYGSNLPTPHLDAMAAHGARFAKYNSTHPICSASRAAVLTGRYGHRSGTTGAFGPHSPTGTSLNETLLSDLFRAAGYKTKAIGKWHLGDAPQYLPTNRGFDSYYGVPYSDDMQPLPLIRNTTILEQDTTRELLTPRYTEEALKFIDQNAGHPFFLYLAFSYPHDPARASERFRGKTEFGDFGDSVAEIDWSAGEIFAALERKGIASDTLVCFTSDHGSWYQGSPGPLRGRKASTFEGGFRVPFLAKWPGVIAPGKVVNEWCSSLDILPTLSTLCKQSTPRSRWTASTSPRYSPAPRDTRSNRRRVCTSARWATRGSICIAFASGIGSCEWPKAQKARFTSTIEQPAQGQAPGYSILSFTISTAIQQRATMWQNRILK
jgi:arylsulfatase A